MSDSLPVLDLPGHAEPLAALPIPDALSDVPPWRSAVLLLLGLLMLVTYWVHPTLAVPKNAGVVMVLPDQVGLMHAGAYQPMSLAEKTILPRDTEFVRRNYQDDYGNQVICTIVLSGAAQQSIHRPEVCTVAQGWTITDEENVPVSLVSGHPLVVRNLHLSRELPLGDGRQQRVDSYYMYWFVGENVTTPSHWTRVFLTNWDRIVHNRAHRWAYVSVTSMIGSTLHPFGMDQPHTRELLVNFIHDAVPSFQKSEMPE